MTRTNSSVFFEIQTDRKISARRPDLIIISKKERTCGIVDFVVPADNRVKLKEIEKKGKNLDLPKKLKNTVELESEDYTNFKWCSWYSHQRIGTRTGGFGKIRTGVDCPSYSIVEIVKNTEKSTGDLRALAVTQTPVEHHQQTLMWKTLKE